MNQEIIVLEEISLLITHYNRSAALERLLNEFRQLNIEFNEIIVSDDASNIEHLTRLNRLKNEFHFKLICSEKNGGLANNINKGQQLVISPYTLYIQEDFIPRSQFRKCLIDGLSIVKQDPSIDLVRFYAYEKHPYLKPIREGFLEMEFHFWKPSYRQFFCYSDHPHLRRSTFPDKFGYYKEGIHSDKAEFKMGIAFLQKRGKAIIHENYKGIIDQCNNILEPSQVKRRKFRKYIQMTDSLLIKGIRCVYRNIKFRLQYLIS